MAFNRHKKDKNNLNSNSSGQTGSNADKWVKNDQSSLAESTNSNLFDKNESSSYGNYKDSNSQPGLIHGNSKPKKKHPKSGAQKFGLSDSYSSLGSSSGTQQIFHQSETFHPHSTQLFVEKPQAQDKLENASPTLISCSGSEANGTPRNALGVNHDNASWQNFIETGSENSQSSNYQSQSSFSHQKKKYDRKNQTNYSNNSYQNNQGHDKFGQGSNNHWDNNRQQYSGHNNPRGDQHSNQKKTNYRENVIFYEKTDTNQINKQQGSTQEWQKEPENRNNGNGGRITESQNKKQIRSNVEKQILQTQASNSLQYPALSIVVPNITQPAVAPTASNKQPVNSCDLEAENSDKHDSLNVKIPDPKQQSYQWAQPSSQVQSHDDCISFRVLTGSNNSSKGYLYVSVNSNDLSEESLLEEKLSEQLAKTSLDSLTIINLKLKIVDETLNNLINGSLSFVQDYENTLNTLVKLLHFYTSTLFNPQNEDQAEDFTFNTNSVASDQSSSQQLLINPQVPISPQSPYGFQSKSQEIKNNNNQQYQQITQQSQISYPFPQQAFIPSLPLPIQYMQQQQSYPQYPPNYYPAQPFPIPQFYQNPFLAQPYPHIQQQKQQQPPQQKQQRGQYSNTMMQGINSGNSYVPQTKKNFNKVGGGGFQKNQTNYYFEEETNNQ